MKTTLQQEVENVGYEWTDWIFDARDFGLPQCRRRYFAICVQGGVLPSSQYLQGIQGKQSKNFQQVFSNNQNTKRWWTSTINSKEEWRIISLNPLEVEKIMGFPLGWTNLDHLETQFVHKFHTTSDKS